MACTHEWCEDWRGDAPFADEFGAGHVIRQIHNTSIIDQLFACDETTGGTLVVGLLTLAAISNRQRA
jgi:hypothetical protein